MGYVFGVPHCVRLFGASSHFDEFSFGPPTTCLGPLHDRSDRLVDLIGCICTDLFIVVTGLDGVLRHPASEVMYIPLVWETVLEILLFLGVRFHSHTDYQWSILVYYIIFCIIRLSTSELEGG